MNSYHKYLSLFFASIALVNSSKHRYQRGPLSPQGFKRAHATAKRRRAARKYSQRRNRA